MSIKSELIARFVTLLDEPMTLSKAIAIAVVAHAGQEDKGQNSYLRHVLRVMEGLDSEEEMVVGVSHDLIEDTFVKLEDLPVLGYTAGHAKAIDALSKREGEDYPSFVQRVKNSYVGVKVKILDIRDNSQMWRIKNRKLTEKDMIRQQHYIDALAELGALNQRTR